MQGTRLSRLIRLGIQVRVPVFIEQQSQLRRVATNIRWTNHIPPVTGQPLLSSVDRENFEGTMFGVVNNLESQPPQLYDTFSNASSIETASWSSSRSKIDPRIVSDAILGLSDGLTVPFALSAGLSTLGETKVVVLGGLAELAAGAISMGLGGYVGAKSEE